MKSPGIVVVLLAVLFVNPVLFAGAGSESAPEIRDDVNEPGIEDEFKDIVAVWIENEDISQFQVVFKVAEPPSEWGRDLIGGNRTTFNYEFYFNSNNTEYSLAAVVSIAFTIRGLISAVIADGELRSVSYLEESDTISNESTITGLSVSWDDSRTAFVFTVPKNVIGSPQVGDRLTNLWAAVWNDHTDPYESMRNVSDAVDYANTHLFPGNDYIFTGGFKYLYELEMTVDEESWSVNAGSSLDIPVTVYYNTTGNSSVNTSFSALITGIGSLSLKPESIVLNSTSVFQLNLTYTPPETVDNVTNVSVMIIGSMKIEENNVSQTKKSEPLYLNITVLPGGGNNQTTGGILERLIKWLLSTTGLAIISALVVVGVVAYLVARGRRMEREMYEAEVRAISRSETPPRGTSLDSGSGGIYYRPPPPEG